MQAPSQSSLSLPLQSQNQIDQSRRFKLDFPNFFMRFQFMTNNFQWFQSPRPISLNFTQTHQHRDSFPDLNHTHPNNLTPTLIPYHDLSPLNAPNNNEKPHSHSNFKNQTKQLKNRGINDLVVYSEEDDNEEIETPRHQQKNKKNQELLTTGKKSHTEKNLGIKKSRPKDKGLRGLSLKSLNTVLEMKQGTYKQVANKLLETFEEEQTERPANEETNIKRRVYDALNVLISLGLLKKQGRMIVGQKSPQAKKKEKIKEAQLLRKRLQLKQYILREKKNKLQETMQKYRGIQNIFESNKRNLQIVQINNNCIPFPFVGIVTNSQWRIGLITSQELILQFKEKVHPFGDIDFLNQIQRHFR